MRVVNLCHGWQCKERNPDLPLQQDLSSPTGWLPARVPGTVHTDLLAAGLIPDPFVADNERAVQWVGERDWVYRCRFRLPAEPPGGRRLLRCEGLDTFATVLLNGQPVLTSDNMFLPVEAEVDELLRPDDNELVILFESAARRAREREARAGVRQVWNGDPSRVYARKAQYHWGWDWGPCLLCAGPYRPVRLLQFRARIVALQADVVLGDGAAAVTVRLQAEGPADSARLRLSDPDGQVVQQVEAPLQDGGLTAVLDVPSPRLWWPNGLGAQPLYGLEAALRGDGEELDARTIRLGLRSLELVQDPLPDAAGRSFHFAVNGRAFFAGGANWIPADSFLPRVDEARYRRLLTLARNAGVTMMRVWGGGVYEEDIFYDLCDELGLLVWQDFMFACGLYPAEDWFVRSVRAEAEAQVARLRHHPCLALWCGNNEDYSIAASLGAFPPSRRATDAPPFPARLLYEEVLASVCAAADPQRPYWPGSPWSGHPELDANDPNVGDRHSWEVWHGPMADYQDYSKYAGRFVSEFGMQALPSLATLLPVLPEDQRTPDSEALRWHNKATSGPERLQSYLERNLPPTSDLEGSIYASQLLQAEALGWAIRSYRRRFGSPGQRHTGGALIWQWNDCWPAVSWAVVDYQLVPKASYWVVRRELQPLCIGLAPMSGGAQVWAVNGTDEDVEGELELRSVTLGGAVTSMARRAVFLSANQVTELGHLSCESAEPLIHAARLVRGDQVVARAALWPEPLRALPLVDPGLEMEAEEDWLRLRVRRPAKGVLLSIEDVALEDNVLDLLPDEEIVVPAPGLARRKPAVRWLGGRLTV
ncbi:MAG: hypothetical protein RMK29_17905 [Myxococcales bacterium]|nr:glycoside hydrolase family 2 protein [Myxococcota bacterium]MDW8283585.1 hypothetical protein [Myxococcales bacterium]